MPRSLTTIFALGVAGATLLPAPGEAAGRAGGPMPGRGVAAVPTIARSHGLPTPRAFGHLAHGLAKFHGRGFVGWPPLPLFDDGPQVTILRETAAEPEKPFDRNSMAYLPARTGMSYPPAPDPVLIRLEGPRDRPVARIIPIAEAEAGNAPRNRFVHAPTGALLLTVPGR